MTATPLLGAGDSGHTLSAATSGQPLMTSARAPMASSTPARPGSNGAPETRHMGDMSDIITDKENLTNGNGHDMLPSPHSTTSGYKSDADSERTHDQSRDSRDSSVFDDYLSVPVRRKTRDSGYMPSVSESMFADSVFGDDTDVAKQDRLSPIQNIMQYRSPSPSQSTTSKKSKDSTLSGNSTRNEVDYGKFFNTSYLEKPMGVSKGPSINLTDRKPTHYHRPENFSYSQVRKDFIRPLKKENSSMMSALGDATTGTTKKRLEDFMEEPMRNRDVIALAKFPDSHRRDESDLAPIEREDWPAPNAAAAAYPELLYHHHTRRQSSASRRSRGESSEMDVTDNGVANGMDVDEDTPPVDVALQKDIEHLSRLQSESGAAKLILEDLKKKAAEPPPLIDVISASRTPSASKEPHYRTRYESHVFASPSRDLDYHPRTYALDDQVLDRKYRNALQSVGNYPAMKPGYTLRAPRTAHMPATFASARANGYFSDIEQCVTRDSDFDDVISEHRKRFKTPSSINTSQSSLEEYDPHTGLRRGSKLRGSSLSTDYNKSSFRKSFSNVLNKDEPPKIYSFEELKLTNPARPPGTDINWLEVHLEDSVFHSIFSMNRYDFYRLAEWKRNDLKKRNMLF